MKTGYLDYLKKIDFLNRKSQYYFVDGLAIVEKDGLLGCLNENLEWQIKPEYLFLYLFPLLKRALGIKKSIIGKRKITNVVKKKRIFNFQDPFTYETILTNEDKYKYDIFFIDYHNKIDPNLYKTTLYDYIFFFGNNLIVESSNRFRSYDACSTQSINLIKGTNTLGQTTIVFTPTITIEDYYPTNIEIKIFQKYYNDRILLQIDGDTKNENGAKCKIYNKNLELIFDGKTKLFYEKDSWGGVRGYYSNEYGFVIIDKNNLYGWMDRFGNIVIKPQFYDLFFTEADSKNNYVERIFTFKKTNSLFDFGTSIQLELLDELYLKPKNIADYQYFNQEYFDFINLL